MYICFETADNKTPKDYTLLSQTDLQVYLCLTINDHKEHCLTDLRILCHIWPTTQLLRALSHVQWVSTTKSVGTWYLTNYPAPSCSVACTMGIHYKVSGDVWRVQQSQLVEDMLMCPFTKLDLSLSCVKLEYLVESRRITHMVTAVYE